MKPQETPIHIVANKEDIASNVIVTGDPLRAKYIAETFLQDYKLVNTVRNAFGYTGLYNGKKVSVMAIGMGIPSAGIYIFELLYYYNVQRIIRVGTCGAVQPYINLKDIILSDLIYSDSEFAYVYNGYTDKTVKPSTKLNDLIIKTALELKQKLTVGTTITTSVFGPYADIAKVYEKVPKELNILGEEMEGFAICHLANAFGREAAMLVSVTDSQFTKEFISVDDRRLAVDSVIKLALESIVK